MATKVIQKLQNNFLKNLHKEPSSIAVAFTLNIIVNIIIFSDSIFAGFREMAKGNEIRP